MTPRPVASLSLDLDDLWTYLRTHGDPAWSARPSYLATFVPRMLDLLDECGVSITWFLVGHDAARDEHHDRLRAIAERGHEIGNHTFEHEPWLQRYTPAELDEELGRAEAAIEAATGVRPMGFRGPGFSWSPSLLRTLVRRGYAYDASTFPTFLGPLARLYFLATARLTPEERERRAGLFGTWRDGLRPLGPYEWDVDGRPLLEMPVTTIPGVRAPFHLSYLIYLSRISTPLATGYLRAAIAACRAAGVGPSFLLHPLDLLGADEAPGLAFFPGMTLPVAHKRRVTVEALRLLGEAFELVPMGEHARRVRADAAAGRARLRVEAIEPTMGAAPRAPASLPRSTTLPTSARSEP
ncbi:MAG TPA: polysaccharide deacetylase family protein [Gemmatirosa sp.]|nr:polysaccharide deacetylase family protein [Gemmatirosa sp.]